MLNTKSATIFLIFLPYFLFICLARWIDLTGVGRWMERASRRIACRMTHIGRNPAALLVSTQSEKNAKIKSYRTDRSPLGFFLLANAG
jgi:hypothetical protein